MANPLSIRINDELKEEFKSLSEQSGMKQEDFVSTLLTIFKDRQTETDTGSPVHRERVKVTQALSQIERVVCGFLEIAHNDKTLAMSKAQEQVELTQTEIVELKETLKKNKLEIEEIAQAKSSLEEKLSSLEGQAKSLKALQDAWTEKESNLNSRITELDTEAKETRKLKTTLADSATEIIQLKGSLALAEQKSATDQTNITEIKSRLKKKDTTIEQLTNDIRQARDEASQQVIALNREHAQEKESILDQEKNSYQEYQETTNQKVVSLTKEHAEEKGRFTAQLDFQAQEIKDLKLKLSKMKKSSDVKK